MISVNAAPVRARGGCLAAGRLWLVAPTRR